ncbi:hypothetical protein Acr_00g0074420 [Actinidia rufa]|uniref:Uncharacterized protein n=1 Tax=Actinidia rufa TaxID=165716 RepID=A0A7J0DTP5_9ERIC|nr:hypothetical protein Acr_00g0074420 [Actinidia rufa]
MRYHVPEKRSHAPAHARRSCHAPRGGSHTLYALGRYAHAPTCAATRWKMEVGGDVSGENISEYSLIDEEACLIASKFLARGLGDICSFSQQFSTEWEVDYEPLSQREAGKEVEVKEEVITGEGHIKRDCPKYKAHDQSSKTVAIVVMAVDESDVLLAASEDGKSDWVLDSDSAYHLCRDRERELLFDMGPVVLARKMDKGSNRCTEARKASVGVLGGSGADVHREAQRKETKSILRSYTTKGAVTTKRVFFALDLINDGDLSSYAHKGGEMEPRQLAKSYGGARPETIKIDNLKTSDYPLVGWRGRLLSPSSLE